MTVLKDSTRRILTSFWCDFYPESPCSMVQELCIYVEDNDLGDGLDSVKAYMMCIYDFKSNHLK